MKIKLTILVLFLLIIGCGPTAIMGFAYDPVQKNRIAKGYTIVNMDGEGQLSPIRNTSNPDIFEYEVYIGSFMGSDDYRRRIEYEVGKIMEKYPEYKYWILIGTYHKSTSALDNIGSMGKPNRGSTIRIHMCRTEEEFDKWSNRY
jgi:hypothetical protein|tara:strand:- start:52 stop:486 length:435 start_codon:yes stop_codon:yes gene_type:complete